MKTNSILLIIALCSAVTAGILLNDKYQENRRKEYLAELALKTKYDEYSVEKKYKKDIFYNYINYHYKNLISEQISFGEFLFRFSDKYISYYYEEDLKNFMLKFIDFNSKKTIDEKTIKKYFEVIFYEHNFDLYSKNTSIELSYKDEECVVEKKKNKYGLLTNVTSKKEIKKILKVNTIIENDSIKISFINN